MSPGFEQVTRDLVARERRALRALGVGVASDAPPCLVSHVGRFFLVVPGGLEPWALDAIPDGCCCHIVPLTTSAAIAAASTDFGDRRIVVWTTAWLFEGISASQRTGFAVTPFSDWLPRSTSSMPAPFAAGSRSVVLCPVDRDLVLTRGATLRLSYSLSSGDPALAVRFACNGRYLLLDPLRAPDVSLDTLKGIVAEALPDEESQLHRLYASRYASWPIIDDVGPLVRRGASDACAERAALAMLELPPAVLAPTARVTTDAPPTTIGTSTWVTIAGSDVVDVMLPVEARMLPEEQALARTGEGGGDVLRHPSVQTPSRRSGVVILCGGLHIGGRTEPVQPSRHISIPTDPPCFPTILQWHLERIDHMASAVEGGGPLLVVLVTSPETHAMVSEEKRRLEELLTHIEIVVERQILWDPLESTCRHASLSIL